jgi:hydroxymethylpyrimidine pyrophosphatase-like HAD family hydrolase
MKDKRKTWFLDFDGTIVDQKSYVLKKDYVLSSAKEFFDKKVSADDIVVITTAREEKHKSRIKKFMKENNFKCDVILCEMSAGIRILVNDEKPDGTKTAYAYNVKRNKGIDIKELI